MTATYCDVCGRRVLQWGGPTGRCYLHRSGRPLVTRHYGRVPFTTLDDEKVYAVRFGVLIGYVVHRRINEFTGRRPGTSGWSRPWVWDGFLPNGKVADESYDTRREAVDRLMREARR